MHELHTQLAIFWADYKDPFHAARSQLGEVYRERDGRRTLRFAIGNKLYYLKYHAGVGWLEIIKKHTAVALTSAGCEE